MQTRVRRGWILLGLIVATQVLPGAETPTLPPARTVESLRVAAQQGDADAQLELALAYEGGMGIPADRAEAVRWYTQAAAQGVGVAHLMLGIAAESGDGVPRSYADARVHYERAIEGGVPQANLRLGLMHLEGWGVTRDPALAVRLITKAAEAGYQPAQTTLSDIYMLGLAGIEKNPPAAVEWAERAARQDSAEGQFKLGQLVQKGVGLPADVKRAREWYQLSSGKEYTNAMIGMALTFARDRSDPANLKLALRWLSLAAENGSGIAAFQLAGFHLVAGQHDSRAVERAHALLQRAVANGSDQARETLKLIAGGKDPLEAFTYVTKVPYEERYVAGAKPAEHPKKIGKGPKIIKTLRPTYPVGLKLSETPGEVMVDFVVDTEGKVRDPKVFSSTHPGFEANALAAIAEWRFEPAQVDGRAVNAKMRVPIRFEMPK